MYVFLACGSLSFAKQLSEHCHKRYALLTVCLSVCLSVCRLFSYMPVCLSFGLPFYLSVCFSSVWLYACLHMLVICMSVCLYYGLSVCLSAYLPVCLSLYLYVLILSVSMPVCMSVCLLFAWISVGYVCRFIYLSVCLSVHLSVCLSVHLYVCLSVCCSVTLKYVKLVQRSMHTKNWLNPILQRCFRG